MGVKTTTFRFTEEVMEQMDYLCKMSGCSRTQLLSNFVMAEYDRLAGNPKLQETMTMLKELEAQMKSYMSK